MLRNQGNRVLVRVEQQLKKRACKHTFSIVLYYFIPRTVQILSTDVINKERIIAILGHGF